MGKEPGSTSAEDSRLLEMSYTSWVGWKAAGAPTASDEFAVFEVAEVGAHS